MKFVIRDKDNFIVSYLRQWDFNQKLYISDIDISSDLTVHFSTRTSEKALVVTPIISGNELHVDIPNILLTHGDYINFYVYENLADNEKRTLHEGIIAVYPRSKPRNYNSHNLD